MAIIQRNDLATAILLCASALLWLDASLVHAQPTEEVPFITSPDNVTLEMLSMANVKRGDHVIDLGSGDGRIVILAAKRFEGIEGQIPINSNLLRLLIPPAPAVA